MPTASFLEIAERLIGKYNDVRLLSRWKEAISFATRSTVLSYWIRDTHDVVNIVWLTTDGIRDVAWFLGDFPPSFNFLKLNSLTGFEVRQGENIARAFGYDVDGIYIVRVFTTSSEGQVVWVASSEDEIKRLQDFLKAVANAIATSA